MNFIEKLKSRWELTSNWQIFIVFVVFTITGSTSVRIASPILGLIGVTRDMNPFIYWPIRIMVIFPTYQVLLVLIGSIFGQFKFFWNFQKKMLSRFVGGSKKAE